MPDIITSFRRQYNGLSIGSETNAVENVANMEWKCRRIRPLQGTRESNESRRTQARANAAKEDFRKLRLVISIALLLYSIFPIDMKSIL